MGESQKEENWQIRLQMPKSPFVSCYWCAHIFSFLSGNSLLLQTWGCCLKIWHWFLKFLMLDFVSFWPIELMLLFIFNQMAKTRLSLLLWLPFVKSIFPPSSFIVHRNYPLLVFVAIRSNANFYFVSSMILGYYLLGNLMFSYSFCLWVYLF